MALIKSHNAAAMLQDAIVLDLGDLRRQAEALKQRAIAEADRILAEARAEARRLTDAAEAKGFEAGFANGKAAGFKAGEKLGHDQALKAASEQLSQLQEAWINAARQWDADRRNMLLDARQSLLALAVSMAEKIVRRVPEIDPSIVIDQVAEALEHVARPCDVTIRVSPADRPLLEEALPQMLAEFGRVEHASITDDEAITPGGCIVTAGQGRIDATLETQLNRLIDALLPIPDPQPPAPSPQPPSPA